MCSGSGHSGIHLPVPTNGPLVIPNVKGTKDLGVDQATASASLCP